MEEANCIHHYVQVHVGIRKIYSTGVSKTNDLHGKRPTIEVRTVLG